MPTKPIFMFVIKITAAFLILIGSNQIYCANSDFQGSITPIPVALQKMMIDNTWHEGCPVLLKDLSYLQVSYWGFDNKTYRGELIIHQRLAIELLGILKKLYDAHFPIEKMIMPEKLLGNKKLVAAIEMAVYLESSHDTRAFFCRADAKNPHDFLRIVLELS